MYDILGKVSYLSDIENLVLFERALFKDYSFKYRIKIYHLKYMHNASWTVYVSI